MLPKRMLRCASVAMALFATTNVGYSQAVSDSNHSNSQQLEGTFLFDVTPDPGGPPPFKIIRQFTPTGGVTGPSQVLFGSAVSGEWTRTGSREFAATLISFIYAPTGEVVAITKTRGRIDLNEMGDELTGRFKVENFNLAGNLVTSLNASVRGIRVGVEPLPADLN